MKIVVNDANILIDLIKTGLIDSFFRLECDMHTSNMVINECLSDKQGVLSEFVKEGLLNTHIFEDYSDLLIIKTRYPALTIEDCSVFYLAKTFNAILLTGEKKLRTAASDNEIEVKGIFWIFDELLKNEIITKKEYREKLKELKEVNSWLPEIEFKKRLGGSEKK